MLEKPVQRHARSRRRGLRARLPTFPRVAVENWLPAWLAGAHWQSRRWLARIVRLPPRRGVGIAASLLLVASALSYGVVKGQHLPDVIDWVKDARDAAANSVGFRIAAISLTGEKEVSREEILATAGVTGRASLLFLDADAARARLMANPWIADAAVLKLYPDRLQITITERHAFALWQKDGRVQVIAADGTVLEPYVERRYVKLPLVVGKGAQRQAKDFLDVLDRYPEIASRVRASILVARAALERASEERHRRAAAGNRPCGGLAPPGDARSRQKTVVARYHDGRSAPAGSCDRAVVGYRCAGPRRGAESAAKKKKKGGDA